MDKNLKTIKNRIVTEAEQLKSQAKRLDPSDTKGADEVLDKAVKLSQRDDTDFLQTEADSFIDLDYYVGTFTRKGNVMPLSMTAEIALGQRGKDLNRLKKHGYKYDIETDTHILPVTPRIAISACQQVASGARSAIKEIKKSNA